MAESLYSLLSNESLAANGALSTCGKTGVSAIGSNSLESLLGVAESLYSLLSNENLAADGALLTLGKTGVGAIGSNSLESLLGVAGSGSKLLAAYGTGLSVGTVCCRAFSVAKSGNYGLSNESFAASRALLTLGKTGSGTGCCFCGSYYLGVTGSGNSGLSNENLAAIRALLTLGKTAYGTGSCNCRNNFLGVICEGNTLLSNENLVTNGAMLTFGKTGGGTGSCYSRINSLGVTESLNDNSLTYGTGLSGGTVSLCAGLMSLSLDYLLSLNNLITSGAVLTFSKTVLGTGSRNSLVNDYRALMLALGNSPLSHKSDGSGNGVLIEVPFLTAASPANEYVAVLGGFLGLGNETTLFNHLGSDAGAALTVELYFKFFYLGSAGGAAECAEYLVTGSECQNYNGE